jgi:uncharacterized membrane protein
MSDEVTETVVIDAPLDRCLAVATDFDSYPQWAHDVKDATVIERDGDGRAALVDFRAAAMGRSAHYQLRYDHSDSPERLSWHLISADLMTACDGSYLFTAREDGRTEVIYHLAIELTFPLPGFVKRRAEVRILNTVKELKQRVEAMTAAA